MTLQEARRLLRSLAMLSPGQMAFDREKATRIVTQLVELLEELEGRGSEAEPSPA